MGRIEMTARIAIVLASALLGGCEIFAALGGGSGLPCHDDQSCPAEMRCIEQRCTLPPACQSNIECRAGRCVDGLCVATADGGAGDGATDAGRSDVARRDAGRVDGAVLDVTAIDQRPADRRSGDAPASDARPADVATADAAPGDARLGVGEVCALYRAYSGNQDLCRDAPTIDATAISAHDLAITCRPGTPSRLWAEDLLAAESAGRVAIDWAQASDCLDHARAARDGRSAAGLLRLPEWSALQGACRDFYSGRQGVNATCVHDWDCSAGLGCYTDNPHSTAAVRCRPPGALGADCHDDYYPCAEGLYCDGSCVRQSNSGDNCSNSEECLSGQCSNDRCAPMPLAAGAACGSNDRCAGVCMGCRPAGANAPTTCLPLAGRGAYCTSDGHCLHDLDCTSNACGTSAAGSACGFQDGHHCDPGLSCVSEIDCPTLTSQQCASARPICDWDSNAGCITVQGTCASLPASGPCLYNRLCADGVCCASATHLCQPCAGLGESCSVGGAELPTCALGLRCNSQGACELICLLHEDCPNTGYCDVASGYCSLRPATCGSDSQCPRDQYCTSNNQCADRKSPGVPCINDTECVSGACYNLFCTVVVESGCNGNAKTHTPDFLRAVFLLGSVVCAGGLWRRRGR